MWIKIEFCVWMISSDISLLGELKYFKIFIRFKLRNYNAIKSHPRHDSRIHFENLAWISMRCHEEVINQRTQTRLSKIKSARRVSWTRNTCSWQNLNYYIISLLLTCHLSWSPNSAEMVEKSKKKIKIFGLRATNRVDFSKMRFYENLS